jgi:hypothetical protein
MNVLLDIQPLSDAARIAHSVLAYDRATEELDLELPIPLFLDTLAVKIAKVPPADKYGALSYPLDARAVGTFRFFLGLDVDLRKREYFLEPTSGHATSFGPEKLAAVELLAKVTPHPRYGRTEKPRISERELVVPTLRLLDAAANGWMATTDITARLTELFTPSGHDAKSLEGRNGTDFAHKVRSMISHRDQPSSFIHRGLAHYTRHGLQISDQGRSAIRALLS